MNFRFDIISEYSHFLVIGTLLTIGLSIAAVIFGTIIGLIICLGKMSKNKVISSIFTCYVGFFRGTPLLVQILIMNFGVIPAVIGETNGVIAAIASLSLNSAAYIAETIRAGIQSVHRGQMEASRSLGMTHAQSMRYIILPQALKSILPALGNEFVSLIKDSSLASTIATPELMYWAQAMNAQYYRVWEPYLASAAIYLVLTLSMSGLVSRLERRSDAK
ncbi:amino acid ABC transporter permease [Clostridium sp.]|nr:amino acid ABC transporter permease [Clostridium sp.]MCI1716627.1 amino acid ABC transporter permease [Clostridium sp.]MCI1800891.1 amino acid ABC transporter permease [Clostridium sp.]MCI1814804.1 amino acid ABC transporter permease [Clostridium sp.]MCI1871638.1 amino acid ABC transporter permease [Clostridium sp.]MCI2201765.1 amino acid ABC transporter permease [Clostridium sp.]